MVYDWLDRPYSFYSVVGGWILSYIVRAFTFSLTGKGLDFGALFSDLISNPWEVLIAQAAFMLITLVIVQAGIKKGIEAASKWMMPLLFIFFILLFIRSITLDGAIEGVKFMFIPDWSYFNGETLILALGQAFFSLSIGVAAMITYASYLSKREKIVTSAINVASMNIAISLLAGLVIFPAVFALGFSPTEGPGLVFIMIPAVFEQLPFGSILLLVFFILLLFATITSSIALLEVVVSIGIREKTEKRKKASWIFAAIIFIVGIPSALSFGILADVQIMDRSIFDFVDYITSAILMPIGALLTSIFAGYHYSKKISKEELQTSPAIYHVWLFIVRYLAPISIVAIIVNKIFFS